MKSRFVVTALLALLPASALAKPPAPPPNGAPSKAVTKEIVDAVAQEMNRSMTMQIEGAPAPTSISYKITEVDVNDAAASLGQLTSKGSNRHFVNIEARVRVSFNGVDNSNFAVPTADDIDGVAAMPLPLEATPRIARRATWLVTDAAYKEALIQLRAKLESRRAAGTRASDVPGWTTEKPFVSDDAVLVPELESIEDLETRAKTLSALFRDEAQIRDSRVAITSYLERRWYITSEGTSVSDTRRASGIVIAASGRADDGQPLGQYFLRYGHTAKDLPNDKELTEEVKKISDNITALAKAPLMERYRGPVLFEGEGAVGLLRFSLAPNLGGTPVPEGINPQEAKAFGGAFNDQIGVRVLAPSLTITDDPTARDGNGKALIGGYKIDDEGVPAQKVEVIKNGMLETLLTSRTPSQKGQVSNGHARRTADGGAFHGSATNLFVTGKGAQPRKALEAQVVAQAKAQGLKYGLIVKQFDDAAITAAPEFSRRELIQMVKTADIQLPPPTSLAYRVYPGGKMELVRGAQLDQLPMTAWEDVLGVSKEITTYNFLASDQNQLSLKLTGGTDDGFVPSGGIESGIVTPDLLLKRVDVRGATGGELPAPLLPQPTSK
ncbi:MAG TPA: metallopeptidase TldD-related protein [Kofleriaceae bacterium]